MVTSYLADPGAVGWAEDPLRGAARLINLEQLPACTHELKPPEWVWSYLKIADLAIVACDFRSDLVEFIRRAKICM